MVCSNFTGVRISREKARVSIYLETRQTHSGKAFLLKVVLLKPLVQYDRSLLMIACLSHHK